MATATPETIRNRIAALLEALTPTSLSGDKFRQSRDEAGADFVAWAEKNPGGCFRRFQVRASRLALMPQVSNVDLAQLEEEFAIRVAYPQTHRFGGAAGRDRDDVIAEDLRKLNYTIGIYGRANFSSTHDCTPLGMPDDAEIEYGTGVDFLVVRARFLYTLDVDG